MEHDKYHIYLKLAIDGKTSKPFSAATLPPSLNFKSQRSKDSIIALSRQRISVRERIRQTEIQPGMGEQRLLL